jgi:hypothetical protein
MDMMAERSPEERFVDLIWNPALAGTEEECTTIVKAVLQQAGFRVLNAMKDKTFRKRRDFDGDVCGEFTANPHSGYVTCEHREGNYYASIWLELICSKLLRLYRSSDKETALKFIKKEIARSIPLKPITLTEYGEQLRECPRDFGLVDHAKDTDALGFRIGIHDICNGWVDIKIVSATHRALVCRDCHLRVVIPTAVKTYGDLREHFAKLQ